METVNVCFIGELKGGEAGGGRMRRGRRVAD